ncbi:MAG: hypothetical protein B6241_07925 [Spirochaetaceae bacterium 4572_59]|nr:MAG: hypothetical protein B6241_07925 [Spirochaetaceae bacterium 4572_59]
MTLSSDIYRKIMDLLLSGELLPGQNINRRQIASDFDVSVAPVLEAMVRLEHEGLLETIPRKGSQVRLIREEDVLGQFILRDALESKAARIYYGDILKEKMNGLEPFARLVDQAPSDQLEDWRTEIIFHRELVSLAGIPALTEAFDRTMKLNLFYAMARIIPVHLASERDNHVDLLKRLVEAPHADRAEEIIRSHVWYGKESILKENITV